MRVVIDTNVMISGYLKATSVPGLVLRQWGEQAFDLLTSEPLLAEFARSMRYPRVRSRHGLDDVAIDDAVTRLRRVAVMVAPARRLSVIADDPDDNAVLECAVAGDADVIVSGDKKHLLPLGAYAGIPIVSPAEFLDMLDNR